MQVFSFASLVGYLLLQVMAAGLPIESASDLQKILRFETFTTQSSALSKIASAITAFQSRVGALLFLISALLSRGLVLTQPLSLLLFKKKKKKII